MHEHFSFDCSALELIVTEPHTLSSTCGCLVARVCVALWKGWCCGRSVCRMTLDLPWPVWKLELGVSAIALLEMENEFWEALSGL